MAYPRAGGTSFWTAASGGVEEWLHVEAGAVRAREAVAAWEVTDVTVRQRGFGVEVVGLLLALSRLISRKAAPSRSRNMGG